MLGTGETGVNLTKIPTFIELTFKLRKIDKKKLKSERAGPMKKNNTGKEKWDSWRRFQFKKRSQCKGDNLS